ncbi:HdeD family acid-resistance protein [Actinoplanes sp. CA-051413]|uniref:HdeD family acid-resistance protein n=1 Tax=Actinoplanes sp. CA-051413 TaxID=3239899 RepID=UPI003D9563F0
MSASAPYPPETYPAEPLRPDASTAASPVVLDAGERSVLWLALSASVLGVVIGIMMIAWPEATLRVVAVLFGLWLLVHGLVRIVQAIAGRGGRDGAERAILGVIGLFFVISGVVALRNLLASLALIITVIGLMWLIGGLMELISAFGGARGSYRMWHVALGALSMLAGIVVLVWPELSLSTLVYVTGIWMIVMGLMQVIMVFMVRRAVTASAS